MSTFEAQPSDDALRDLRCASPHPEDGGELIGIDPRKIAPEVMLKHHERVSPIKAIRLRCLDCCCGQPKEVLKCTSVACPSWPFRMGVDPFRAKVVMTDEQKANLRSAAALGVAAQARKREGKGERPHSHVQPASASTSGEKD